MTDCRERLLVDTFMIHNALSSATLNNKSNKTTDLSGQHFILTSNGDFSRQAGKKQKDKRKNLHNTLIFTQQVNNTMVHVTDTISFFHCCSNIHWMSPELNKHVCRTHINTIFGPLRMEERYLRLHFINTDICDYTNPSFSCLVFEWGRSGEKQAGEAWWEGAREVWGVDKEEAQGRPGGQRNTGGVGPGDADYNKRIPNEDAKTFDSRRKQQIQITNHPPDWPV